MSTFFRPARRTVDDIFTDITNTLATDIGDHQVLEKYLSELETQTQSATSNERQKAARLLFRLQITNTGSSFKQQIPADPANASRLLTEVFLRESETISVEAFVKMTATFANQPLAYNEAMLEGIKLAVDRAEYSTLSTERDNAKLMTKWLDELPTNFNDLKPYFTAPSASTTHACS